MIEATRFEDDIRYAHVLCEDAKEQTKQHAHKFEAKLRTCSSAPQRVSNQQKCLRFAYLTKTAIRH